MVSAIVVANGLPIVRSGPLAGLERAAGGLTPRCLRARHHDCGRFDVAERLGSLGAAARSMAAFAESLTPDERVATAVYVNEQVINTTAVIRHALHDAEHHLLDIRRGIARQDLRR